MYRKIILAGVVLASGISVQAADWLTEIFYGSNFDLNNTTIIFTPDGDTNYTVSAETITELPINLSQAGTGDIGATNSWYLNSWDTTELNLPGSMLFFGSYYSQVWLNGSGSLSFGVGDPYWSDITRHFEVPRISMFWNHLDQLNDGGSITTLIALNPLRFVVTFDHVVNADGTGESCTVQCEISFETNMGWQEGEIHLSWVDTPGMGAHNTIVGLSAGQGYNSSSFIETDFSAYLGPTGDDLDFDGILDSWEVTYFGHYTNCNPLADSDFDTFNNYQEHIAGTIPTDSASYFHVTSMTMNSTDMVFNWNAVTGRWYTIEWTDDLATPFSPIAGGIAHPQNSYTSSVGAAEGYYKVQVELQ